MERTNCAKIQFVLIQIPLFLIGSFVFLFAFWKRLREDYFDSQIFSAGFYILLLTLFANVVSRLLGNMYWFWFSFVAIMIGVGVGSWRLGLRFFEVLEAVVIALFAPLIGLLLFDGLSQKRPSSFFTISVVAVFIGLYYILNTRYKTFSWYKSGRVGFAGLAILGLFFLTRAVVAYFFPNMVSFIHLDWLISSVAAFGSFLTLANLTFKKS